MPHNNIFNAANNKLHHDMETLLMSLLPFGKRAGQEYVALNPTRHDNKQGSFSVNLISGKWSDFATGDSGGDVVSLYAYLKRVSQYEAAKEILGIKDANTASFLPKAPHSYKVNEKPLSNFIGDLWHECNVANDLVAKYLKHRDITCALPETIREHPSLYHKINNSKYPAMVAASHIQV